jgi:signal transduction histidine kinase
MVVRAHHPTWPVYLAALFFAFIGSVALWNAVRCYGRPIASILVDPDATISSAGRSLDDPRPDLLFPAGIIEVNGEDLTRPPPGVYRSRGLDREIERAANASERSIRVKVASANGTQDIELPIVRMSPFVWWTAGVAMLSMGVLYAVAALIAMWASPRGTLARAFAKLAFFVALLFFSIFDFHTTRLLVPCMYLAYPMVPLSMIALALRLPDDAPLLRRWPWLIWVVDAVGISIAIGFVAVHAMGGTAKQLEIFFTQFLASSMLIFGAVLLVRFLRARGERRDMLRVLVLMSALPYACVALAVLSSGVFRLVANAVSSPLVALTPLATVVAFVRYDIWESRVRLSRLLTHSVIAVIVCGLAICLGTAFITSFGVPLRTALAGCTAGALSAGALVALALQLSDTTIFSSRAQYKPTVEQLSEQLTSIASPEEVAHAVERTVRRWLPCDHIELVLVSRDADSPGPPTLESGAHKIPLSLPPDADELALPVMFQGARLGTLRVGKKRGGALFTSEDLDLLKTITNQGALALAHASAYAELEKRRRQQAAAWRDEREALVETLSAEIAHEVRYPINFFRSIFKRASQSRTLDAEDIEIGCEEVDRLERLVSGLRRMATQHIERGAVEISELCARSEVLLRDRAGKRGIELDLGDGASIRCDVDKVTQILVNLLANALDAADDDGRVGVVWRSGASGGELTVWDTGPGFSGDASRLFAPWYTTKPRGTGLGLAITYRLVRAHGWTVEAQRRDARTVFLVTVPSSDIVGSSVDAHSGKREIEGELVKGELVKTQRRGTVA